MRTGQTLGGGARLAALSMTFVVAALGVLRQGRPRHRHRCNEPDEQGDGPGYVDAGQMRFASRLTPAATRHVDTELARHHFQPVEVGDDGNGGKFVGACILEHPGEVCKNFLNLKSMDHVVWYPTALLDRRSLPRMAPYILRLRLVDSSLI